MIALVVSTESLELLCDVLPSVRVPTADEAAPVFVSAVTWQFATPDPLTQESTPPPVPKPLAFLNIPLFAELTCFKSFDFVGTIAAVTAEAAINTKPNTDSFLNDTFVMMNKLKC